MKPYFTVTMTTGHVFEFPAEMVVADRAAAMLKAHPDEFKTLEEARQDTIELFDDSDQIRDWALNNMDLGKNGERARLVRFNVTEHDYTTAEWAYSDTRALIGELDGESIMRSPVEAVMTAMAASGQLVNATVLQASDGSVMGAAVMIIGNKSIIDLYLGAVQTVGAHLDSRNAGIQPSTNATH